jgi:hypothetical protein
MRICWPNSTIVVVPSLPSIRSARWARSFANSSFS